MGRAIDGIEVALSVREAKLQFSRPLVSETEPFRTEVQGHVRMLGIASFVRRLQFGRPFRTH
jgi:hypothetical protein